MSKPNQSNPPSDKFGTVLRAGQFIIYGQLSGCISPRVGKLLLVEWKPRNEKTYTDAQWDMRTIGVDDDFWDIEKVGPRLLAAKGKLLFANRTIVVSRKFMKETCPRYLTLLDPVTMETKLAR